MIPFRVEFRPGVSLYEQVVYAAKKALISGQLRPGDPFPSVRALSTALKINPNTAHKIITRLLNEELLAVMPGLGTVVAKPPAASTAQRSRLLEGELEKLVVRAKGLGLSLEKVQESVAAHWERLEPGEDVPGPAGKGGRSRK